jgi:hypothetical protein
VEVIRANLLWVAQLLAVAKLHFANLLATKNLHWPYLDEGNFVADLHDPDAVTSSVPKLRAALQVDPVN